MVEHHSAWLSSMARDVEIICRFVLQSTSYIPDSTRPIAALFLRAQVLGQGSLFPRLGWVISVWVNLA